LGAASARVVRIEAATARSRHPRAGPSPCMPRRTARPWSAR